MPFGAGGYFYKQGRVEMKGVLLSSSALLFLAASGAGAWADDQGVETIVVTAEKRTESAQNVGVALTVLSADDLVKRGIENVNGLQYATPSLSIVPAFGSGQPEFRLRGVGFDDYGSNNSSTVGVYIDEVAYPVPAETQGLLFDLQRTEILYGPQGTLYGINTTGGAINFVTNKPTDTFTAGVTSEYDSHGESLTNGYVSGPIADGLEFRLAGITDQGGAWQTNRETGQNLGDKSASALRGQLQWNANNDWTFLLQAHWGTDRSQPVGLYLFDPIPAGSYPGVTTTVPAFSKTTQTGWGGSAAFGQLVGISPNAKPYRDNDSDGLDFHADGNLGFAELTWITSYNELHRREYNDWRRWRSQERISIPRPASFRRRSASHPTTRGRSPGWPASIMPISRSTKSSIPISGSRSASSRTQATTSMSTRRQCTARRNITSPIS